MTLALLQIIRDVGLPAPAGGILISPWCDLTHSFPSVLTNTTTDIIPPYGLSLHKPSALWPPPSDELTAELRGRMTQRLREVVKQGKHKLGLGNDSELDLAKLVAENSRKAQETQRTAHHRWWKRKEHDKVKVKTARGDSGVGVPEGATMTPVWDHTEWTSEPVSAAPEDIPLPPSPEPFPRPKGPKRQATVDPSKGPIEIEIDGEIKTVKSQIQFYAQNHQLTHPLVSPALGYLGGLPPLFVLASDKEVLRDEIIYIAHKAAHPERYPVKPETKELLPSLKDIESKGYEPTKVHLQVYDETCHVLPLFSFTTPAKYCYRAIALFCKHVTESHSPSVPHTPVVDAAVTRSPETEPAYIGTESAAKPPVSPITLTSPPTRSTRRLSITSPISLSFSPSRLRRNNTRRSPAPLDTQAAHPGPTSPVSPTRESSGDIAGPRFQFDKNEPPTGVGTAGDPSVYNLSAIGQAGFESPFKDNMIRERVATDGILRPLEPEDDLAGCTVPLEMIGTINASAVKRYLHGQTLWDSKFSGTIKSIAKTRVKNLELARKEGRKSMGAFVGALAKEGQGASPSSSVTFLGASNWSMGWALEDENPPPSSIVSRRDTAEARQLAICADRDLSGEENKMSGNNLWNIVVDFLSQNPDRGAKSTDPHLEPSGNSTLGIQVEPPTPSSPIAPTHSPALSKRRSSSFLRKLMGKDAPDTSNAHATSAPNRPPPLFMDPSPSSGLAVDKP